MVRLLAELQAPARDGEVRVDLVETTLVARTCLARAAGESPFVLFDRLLGIPMRIERFGWWMDDARNPYGGGGTHFLARDFLKFGQLMLNGGVYGGREYFSKDVADAFVQPFAVNPSGVPGSTIGLGWRLHSQNAAAYYYFNWGPSRSTYPSATRPGDGVPWSFTHRPLVCRTRC